MKVYLTEEQFKKYISEEASLNALTDVIEESSSLNDLRAKLKYALMGGVAGAALFGAIERATLPADVKEKLRNEIKAEMMATKNTANTEPKTCGNLGLEIIKKHEGLRLKAYKCSSGKWTIGYGHRAGVKPGMEITPEQAEEFLKQDLKATENAINRYNLNLTQNQFDALCAFVFNIGMTNFAQSTILKKIQANPTDETIRDEFAKWKLSAGKVAKGLVNRRADECALYFKTN